MRKYLEVYYTSKEGSAMANIKYSEVYLINKILWEDSIDGVCKVEMKEVSTEEFEKLFKD